MKICLKLIVLALFISSSNTIEPSIAFTNKNTQNELNGFQQLQKFCETALCRKNIQFRLKKKNGTTFEHSSPLGPPVFNGNSITIFPEETLYIEADEGDLSPENLRLVSENINPEQTFVITFYQSKDIGDGIGMLLSVFNPFSKVLKYNLGMMPLSSNGIYKTSSCPVMSKITAFEMWNEPIFQMFIGNMRYIENDGTLVCEE